MPAQPFVDKLNEQIAHEYAAHQQYVALAVYYDAQTLPRLAEFFYAQALEERNHAMMMVEYLLDQDVDSDHPRASTRRRTRSPTSSSRSQIALEQEKRVTDADQRARRDRTRRTATTPASSSCSGSSRSRSRRSPRCPTC